MSDAALDAAAQEATNEEVVNEPVDAVEEEAVEEVEVEEDVEEEIEEEIDDILPEDHKERSKMGRKVAALFDQVDDMKEIAKNQQKILEYLTPAQEPDYTDDEYVTKADLKRMSLERVEADSAYENEFKSAFTELSEDLDEDTRTKVGTILIGSYNKKYSDSGYKDGAKAYSKALSEYMTKKTPLQNKRSSGVINGQKVKTREKPLVKLSASAASLLKSIERDRGPEAALRMHKEMSK